MIYNLNLWSVEVVWQPPAIPNGIITEYEIKYASKTIDQSINKTIIISNANEPNSVVIKNLVNGTAYWLMMAARTSAGLGPFSPVIDFVIRDGGIPTLFFITNQFAK